jgi:RES domain
VRDLRIIDCSKYHTGLMGLLGPGLSASREEGFWCAIDAAFAKPVGREDDVSDYVPTQILAELFKANGYDGVRYKSLLDDDGLNIALFNMDDAELLSCSLFKVDSLKFGASDQNFTYYTKP